MVLYLMVWKIAGQHAVVTGGGRGIGRSIARALTQAGAMVTILGRNGIVLDDAVAAGDAAAGRAVDVTDRAALLAALADQEWGILVNNAGAVETNKLADTGPTQWDRTIALNLTAVFDACHAVLPGMMARGAGRVVSIASTAGLVGYPYVSAYCAAKHGVVGLTRALALEAARTGVTVNAVCPGYTDTDLIARSATAVAARTRRDVADIRASYARTNPMGRLIDPDEVADAVLYLCRSPAMTGQALAVAGGEVMA